MIHSSPLPVSLAPSSRPPLYGWRNVPIGGGGYVTGLALHPTESDQCFIRTDVGGVYRLDAAARAWRPLMDSVPYPARNYMGVDGLALARSRPGRVALAAGQHLECSPSDVLLSDDSGQTWRETGLRRAFGGNLPHRMDGECLAFAPDDADHLVVGTRQDGLFETRDGGQTWRQVPEVPFGDAGIGIRSVLFSADAIYAAVAGEGIFMSPDRGVSWHEVPDSPRQVGRLASGADGTLFASARDPGAVWRYDGRWHDISPMRGRNYHALAVDPQDAQRVLVSPLDDPSESRFRLPIFLSTDGGANWRVVAPELDWSTAARWMKPSHFAAATSTLVFDPHHAGRVYLADWYAVWVTDDIMGRPVHWRALMTGHEEMFLFALASPPTGAPLLTAMADNVGFRHEQPEKEPTGKIAGGQEASGLDFCEADPNRVAVVSGRRSPALEYAIYVSDDNGRTFVTRAVPVEPSFERVLRVAVSATERDHFVLLANSDMPYFTRDAGRSWAAAQGVPAGALPGRTLWCYHHPLAADRVAGDCFYLYHAGGFYVSRDGGARWQAAVGPLPTPTTGYINVIAAPGQRETVAIGLGDAGLWLTLDAGRTMERVPYLAECLLVSWGRPLEGSLDPTLFVYGRHGETWGIFRSPDHGHSWSRITTDEQPLGCFPSCLVGDRQQAGRVYLGTNGRGVFCGTPLHVD
jgi:xyloglucan-specific exo-beta-1,4-glucanase